MRDGRNSDGRSHTKDDGGNVDGAQHAEFVRLFEEAVTRWEVAGEEARMGGRRRRWGEC